MPSYRKFENNERKYKNTKDVFQQKKEMVLEKDISDERRNKYIAWITFYRRNIHRFVMDYFGIKLYPFQIIWLYLMSQSSLFVGICSRAASKSFLISVYALALAVLYPGSEIIIASSTIKQAGLIISEKMQRLRDDFPNIQREIKSLTANMNNYEAVLHCGSKIKVVPAAESARGNRATMLSNIGDFYRNIKSFIGLNRWNLKRSVMIIPR